MKTNSPNNKKTTKWILIFLALGTITFIFVINFRWNKWQKHLNSKNRTITYCYVYDYSSSSNSTAVYYDYVYKVENQFYYESTSGRNVNKLDLEKGKIQVFTLVASNTDPSIHCVIWSQKHKYNNQYGEKLDIKLTPEIIKKFTRGIGLSARGEIDQKEVDKFIELSKKLYTTHR